MHSFFSTTFLHLFAQAAFFAGHVSGADVAAVAAPDSLGETPHWHDQVAPAPGVKVQSFVFTMLLHMFAQSAFLAGHVFSGAETPIEVAIPRIAAHAIQTKKLYRAIHAIGIIK